MQIYRGCLVALFMMTAVPAWAENCEFIKSGVASVYSESLNGRKLAYGGRLNMADHTAAAPKHMKNVKDGTKLKVVDTKTGRSTYVTVNDEGPHAKNRVLDLTRAPARDLGFERNKRGHMTGIKRVKIYVCN